MIVGDNRVIRIGAWRVDPALDEISRDGATVKLEPRAMRVLLCLAEHAGQVVSVDRLLDAVWKDVVVTPDSVYQAVAGLRRALGDTSKEPAYIANVLRRGYRLVASVAPWNEVTTAPNPKDRSAEAPPGSVSTIPATTHSRGRLWVLVAVAAALAIGYPIVRKQWPSKQATTAGQEVSATTPGVSGASVAVLPFADMSDKKDQGYFVDGLSEVLIDRLSMVPGLHVPGRVSSFYFKGKQATVPEIAKALGVAHLLEGTVRKAGDTLRITAQLIRVDNGYQIWSETFDRPLIDAFKVQDEIAGAVVQVLKMSILHHYTPEAAQTTSIEAYTLYFRTQSNVANNEPADYDAAAEQLHSALTLDPHFAAAWGWLALVTIWKFEPTAWGSSIHTSPTPAACAGARAAADRALELDSTLVQSHRAKGIVLQYCDIDLLSAEREFRRALELQPGSSDALRSYAWLALASGRLDQALQLAQRAVSLDPLNPWNFAAIGDVSWTGGRWADAEAAYRRAVELGPTDAGLHSLLANILLSSHKAAEAVGEAEQEPDAGWRETALLFALDAAGRKGEADRAIAAYELKYADDDPGGIAAFYACRHDTQRAIQWLSRLVAKHQGEYHDLPNREACLKSLESDSSYKAWRQKLKLT
jgi:TolB-like protein/DNA-binding winged helix-turn-helix (wHTH) protein/Tfp pilus assembly protein PilF